MTNTDTADVESTIKQTLELAEAGSEIFVGPSTSRSRCRRSRNQEAPSRPGCNVPIIGDFHYNGHVLLTKYPDCAKRFDKYRINPGNVGAGNARRTIFHNLQSRRRQRQAVRIGVNGGSLNQELVMAKMQEKPTRISAKNPKTSLTSAWSSPATIHGARARIGLRHDQIIISCKTSRPRDLITVYRDLSGKNRGSPCISASPKPAWA